VTKRRERRIKQLLDELNETRGYWKLEEETLDCTVWRNGLGRSYGPVVKTYLIIIVIIVVVAVVVVVKAVKLLGL
jgi:hypothetical protein